MIEKSIRSFWRAFRQDANSLADQIATGSLRDAFGRVECMLEMYGLNFCFELTEEGQDAVLVLTPEGDKQEAQRIDYLLREKPAISGWRFYARRQRKSLADALQFVRHIYGVDLSDATFDIRQTIDGYVVTMRTRAVEGFTSDEARGLAETFLDSAVGEEIAMSRIAEVVARGDVGGHLSPSELITILGGN